MTAYQAHQAKLTAYAQAETQARWARSVGDFARDTLSNVLGHLKSKPFLVRAAFSPRPGPAARSAARPD